MVSGVLLAVAVASAASGCGAPSIAEEGTATKDLKPVELPTLPPTILDLKVSVEDSKETLDRSDRTYLDKVSLYSLRATAGPQKDLVQATLQIAHFNDDARWKDEKFRASILTQLGGSAPQPLRLGNDDVFITKGQQQSVSVWFRDEYMFILSTRLDFDRPRALLRSTLQVQT